MIISHSKKFIFIHNYKAAGTSIAKSLSFFECDIYKGSNPIEKIKLLLGLHPWIYSSQFTSHIKAIELKNNLPCEIFNNYYKFGFVRNPWDWQVSFYTYILKFKNHHQHKLIRSFRNFDEYIDWRVHDDLHLQKEFFYDREKCLVDFIGKFECLKNDFEEICQKLLIHVKLPHLNRSRENDNFLSYYSRNSLEMVSQAFQEDIDIFKYNKPKL